MSSKKCNWVWETMQKQGKIEISEMEAHRKTCQICKDEARRKMKSVNYTYPLETGWEEPKCPFCFEDIKKPTPHFQNFEAGEDEGGNPFPAGEYQTGYKDMHCKCSAIYSYDPASDKSETIPDTVARLLGKDDYEISKKEADMIDTFIYHNYCYDAHAYNRSLEPSFDVAEDNGTCRLGHLYFVRKRKEGEEPLKDPPYPSVLRGVIKASIGHLESVIERLEKTKSAFKSAAVAQSREDVAKVKQILENLLLSPPENTGGGR